MFLRIMAVAIASVLLAACAAGPDPMQEEFQASLLRCRAAVPVPSNKYVDLGKCINAEETAIASKFQYRYPDIIQLTTAYRLALLRKVDAGEISIEDSDLMFRAFNTKMKSEEIQRTQQSQMLDQIEERRIPPS